LIMAMGRALLNETEKPKEYQLMVM